MLGHTIVSVKRRVRLLAPQNPRHISHVDREVFDIQGISYINAKHLPQHCRVRSFHMFGDILKGFATWSFLCEPTNLSPRYIHLSGAIADTCTVGRLVKKRLFCVSAALIESFPNEDLKQPKFEAPGRER